MEADLNPLIAGPKGVLCVDARVRLEPRHLFDPYLRRLRRPATPALGVLRRDDAAILADLEAVALAPDVGTVASTLRIGCERGQVTVDARTVHHSQADRLRERVRAVEGVVSVADDLRWEIDDVGLAGPPGIQLSLGRNQRMVRPGQRAATA